MFLRITVYFLIFIYPVSLKINVSTYRICVISDTRIVFVHHRCNVFESLHNLCQA